MDYHPTNKTEDTICAISTAPGKGGIAVIRVSGENAITITNKIFKPLKAKNFLDAKNKTLTFGSIITNKGEIVDSVLVAVFKAPHSFTGENTTEISCHGSIYIQQVILELLIQNGCRLAEPGEYTKRAFLNGKMDLSQAEAVADLIASSNAASHKIAMQQMRGGFAHELKFLRDELLKFVSLIELELDFSTEDVEFADREELTELVKDIKNKIDNLSNSFKLGNAIKSGVPVAIIGQTNVGKSTLLNWLLNEDKAIVSDINGTTRDVIEDTFTYDGILFRLIDTAGIRKTEDEIEKIGIERSFKKMNEASIVLLMIDATDNIDKSKSFINEVNQELDGKDVIILINKTDAVDKNKINDLLKLKENDDHTTLLPISAKENQNKEGLLKQLKRYSHIEDYDENSTIVSNMRHYEALRKALNAISRVEEGLDLQLSGDLLSQDIHDCIDALGEITGEISSEDVLQNIFKHFCIGK